MTFYLLSKSGMIPNIRKKRIPLSSCCPKIEINVALSVFMHILHTPVLSLSLCDHRVLVLLPRSLQLLLGPVLLERPRVAGMAGIKATLFLKVAQ